MSRTREEQDRNAEAWLSAMIKQGLAAPFADVFEITPARARAMFARNIENRRHYPSQTRRLRQDISEGRWELNGEALVFAADGSLNDGQHRLRAVIEADRPIRTVVVFGVSRSSRYTLDLGKPRSPADILHFKQIPNASTLASAARLAIAFEASRGENFAALKWMSKTQIIERASVDQGLQEAVHFAVSEGLEMRELVPGSPLAFIRYTLRKINPPLADLYLGALISGENLKRGHPALTVRRYLFTLSNREREPQIAMILRGWDLFRRNQEAAAGDIHGGFPLPDIGFDFGDPPADVERPAKSATKG